MHAEPLAFLRNARTRYPWLFARARVLECGAYSVNGSPRSLFADNCEYIGLDWRPGPGVDAVGLVHEYQPPHPLDVIVATEMLEHDPHWQASLAAMVAHLAPGGGLLLTWASPLRPPHETDCAPGGYYRGLTTAEVSSVVGRLAPWHMLETRTLRGGLDCQLLAVKPLLSAVIGTLGQPALLNCCIQELRRCATLPLEIVVVDNGSTPAEQAHIAQLDSDILVQHDAALGYAAANNAGIAASNGAYVLLCNNDAWPTQKGWDARLISIFDNVPEAGIVAPVSPRVWHPEQQASGAQAETELVQVDRLAFVAPLLRRVTLDAIGPLDERFGAGCFEDDDYCLRVQAAGLKVLLDPGTFFFHVGSVTMRTLNFDALMARNQLLFAEKWGNNAQTYQA